MHESDDSISNDLEYLNNRLKKAKDYNKKPFVWMAFCDAQRLRGFGPCETKVNNIYLQYILFI